MSAYPYAEIEKKWKKIWEDQKLYQTDMNSNSNKNYYCLVMFPYPSGDKLHIGHWYNFGPTDTLARFKRMQGYNVLEPIGYDAFGLPAENYAIKVGIHPAESTKTNIRLVFQTSTDKDSTDRLDHPACWCASHHQSPHPVPNRARGRTYGHRDRDSGLHVVHPDTSSRRTTHHPHAGRQRWDIGVLHAPQRQQRHLPAFAEHRQSAAAHLRSRRGSQSGLVT